MTDLLHEGRPLAFNGQRLVFQEAVVVTQPAPVAAGPVAGSWLSGASGSSAVAGTFGTWRRRPLDIIGTRADDSANTQSNQWSTNPVWSSTPDSLSARQGDIDHSMGAIFKTAGETWVAAANGAYDTRWREALVLLNSSWVGKPGRIFERFAEGFNRGSSPWSVTASEATSFILAWRRFRAIWNEVMDARHDLVWSPSAETSGVDLDVRNAYPGSTFVDLHGVEWFNEVPHVTTSAAFAQVIARAKPSGEPWGIDAHRLFALAQGKSLAVSRWGNNGDPASGGESPAFVSGMRQWLVANAGTGAGRVPYEVYANTEGSRSQLFPSTQTPLTAAQYVDLWATTDTVDPTLPALTLVPGSLAQQAPQPDQQVWTFSVSPSAVVGTRTVSTRVAGTTGAFVQSGLATDRAGAHTATASGLAGSTSYEPLIRVTAAGYRDLVLDVTVLGRFTTAAAVVAPPVADVNEPPRADRSMYPDGTGVWAGLPPLVHPVTREFVHAADGGWPIAEWKPSDNRQKIMSPSTCVRFMFPQEMVDVVRGLNPIGGNWIMHAPQIRNTKYHGPTGQTWYPTEADANARTNGGPPRPGRTYWPFTGRADPGDSNRAIYMQPHSTGSTSVPLFRGIEDGYLKGDWINEGIDHGSYGSNRDTGLRISLQRMRHDRVSVNYGRRASDGTYFEKTGGDFFQIWTSVHTLYMRDVTAHSSIQGIFLTGDVARLDWERVNMRSFPSPEEAAYLFWLPNTLTSSRLIDVWATAVRSRDSTIWPKVGAGTTGLPINYGAHDDFVRTTAKIGLQAGTTGTSGTTTTAPSSAGFGTATYGTAPYGG